MHKIQQTKTRILITSAGSTTAMSVMKSLRISTTLNGLHIVATDIFSQHEIPSLLYCDEVYTIPKYNEPTYIEEVLSICKKEKINLIIPILDQEVELITKHKSLFSINGIMLAASDYHAVKVCNDKYLTYITLKNHGIITPTIYLQNDFQQQSFKDKKYFLKPRFGVSSSDCYKINHSDELHTLLMRVENPIIQEYLSGDKYVVDTINDLDGKNIVAIPRLEITAKAGVGIKAITKNNKSIIQYSKYITESLGIKGVSNIELFVNKENIFFIEINPRFSAGSILSTAAGLNLAEIVVEIFTHKLDSKRSFKWKSNIFMTRYWQELYFDKGVKFEL